MLPLLMTLATSTPLAREGVDLYVGTYTSPEGSRGVYRARLDERTGAISAPTLAVAGDDPSYLALGPGGKTLYAVHETDPGAASAYRVEEDGGLTRLGTVSGLGAAPCHLSVGAKGRNLLVASYGPGTVAVLPILEDGSLSGVAQTFRNAGSGPNRARQEGPHAHFAQTDAKGRFAYVCDLGTDEILAYPYDSARGELGTPDRAKATPGAGPRHLAFGPDGRFAYVNDELSNAVVAYAVDPDYGSLTAVQVLSSLPEGFAGASHSAEIAVHPNGRTLYVSNRGDDSLATFEIGKDGTLRRVAVQPVGAKEPRGFGIDPSGRWIVVAGQSSDELVSFPLDPKTGRLGSAAGRAKVGKPTCVVFRD